MTISLSPQLESFVQAKVKIGEFLTPEAVVEAALCQMMGNWTDQIGPKELAEQKESLAQMNRGEGGDWPTRPAEWLKGEWKLADSFSEPLSDDVLDLFEGMGRP